jgi:hypothetical protein
MRVMMPCLLLTLVAVAWVVLYVWAAVMLLMWPLWEQQVQRLDRR